MAVSAPITTRGTQNFDDRFETRITAALKNHITTAIGIEPVSLTEELMDPMRWVPFKQINAQIQKQEFGFKFGEPRCIVPGNHLIIIGFSKGAVMVFSYKQELVCTLFDNSMAYASGSVTCLALSNDSEYVAVGYSQGGVILWDVTRPKSPVLEFTKEKTRHAGAIRSVGFVGKRHTGVVSCDENGNVMFNNGYRTILGLTYSSKLILSDESLIASATLPLGNYPDTAVEKLNLMATLSTTSLCIVSTHPVLTTQVVLGKPLDVDKSKARTGCVAWIPGTELKQVNGGGKTKAQLCYCFSNVLSVIEVTGFLRDGKNVKKDEPDAYVQVTAKKRWICEESISSVHWVNVHVLAVYTVGKELIFLDTLSMSVVGTMDLLDKHVLTHNALRFFREKAFTLSSFNVEMGEILNWSDVVLHLVNTGKYEQALARITDFYVGNDKAGLSLLHLPQEDVLRHSLLKKPVTDLMFASVKYVSKKNVEKLEELLRTCFTCCVNMGLDPLLYERLLEGVTTTEFFAALEPFILTKKIRKLTPTVFKEMVLHYIGCDRGLELEEMICILDITTLDIDLTLRLLKEHNLRESQIYIWNNIFKDYVSPLVEFFDEIREGPTETTHKVFSYLAYTLTGRQYPTDNYINDDVGKLSVYKVLLSGTVFEWPANSNHRVSTCNHDDEPAFPYIMLLLNYDCASLLSCLNEAFEDPCLNDSQVTRQYIVDVVLECFRVAKFSKRENTLLAIFITRNFPKYQQYIRLSNQLIESMIETICMSTFRDLHEDCQLSLQALFSVYHPIDVSRLVTFLETAGYDSVLFNLYLHAGNYAKMLKSWLKSDTVLSNVDVLKLCLSATDGLPQEKSKVVEVITGNLTSLLQQGHIKSCVSVIETYCPEVHESLYDLENKLQVLYLEALPRLNRQFRTQYIIVLLSLNQVGKLEDFLKTAQDYDTVTVTKVLRDHRQIGALVTMLKDDPQSAVDEIVQDIEHITEVYLESSSQSVQDELNRNIVLGIQVCERSSDEALWLKLVETTVKGFNKVDHSEVYNRAVQDVFTSLINSTSQKFTKDDDNIYRGSFWRVFNKLLEDQSVGMTKVQDLRPILSQIFLAYQHEEASLSCTLKLLNKDGAADMDLLFAQKCLGWSIKNVKCEVCDKRLWGAGLDSSVFSVWEERQLNGGELDEKFDPFGLVIFNCQHGFHKTCLQNLGNVETFECVLCDH